MPNSLLDLVGPTAYVGFQSALDSTVHGWNYYWKSTHLPELRADLIDVIAEHAFSSSSSRSYAALFHLKGAVSRVAEGGTAFGHRVLPADLHVAIEEHVAGCPRCAAFVASYRDTPRILREATAATLPPDLEASLKAFLRARTTGVK